MKVLSAATMIFSATHTGTDGRMHGHSYEVTVWWPYDHIDVLSRRRELDRIQIFLDHRILTAPLVHAEAIAGWVLCELDDAIEVEVRRPLERFSAKAVR